MAVEFAPLLADIKARKFQPVYLLCGEEPYFIDKVTEAIEENALNDMEKAFNQTICYGKDYPFYNSWEPTVDAINTSQFNTNRFVMQTPEQDFPTADVVFSQLSWCFHYPKEVYWNKVMSCLKQGGILQLDVRILQDTDVIGEISEDLKSNPIERKFPKIPDFADNYPTANPEHAWSRCMWIKNV